MVPALFAVAQLKRLGAGIHDRKHIFYVVIEAVLPRVFRPVRLSIAPGVIANATEMLAKIGYLRLINSRMK